MSTHPSEELFAYAANVAAELLLSEDYITVPLPLANLLGLEKAVLLKAIDAWCISNQKRESQTHYKNGQFWTYGSYEEWAKRLPFLGGTRSLQRLFLSLEKLGLLLSDVLATFKGDRRKWYRVDRQKLGLLYLSKAIVPKIDDGYSPATDEHKHIVPKVDGDSTSNRSSPFDFGSTTIPEVDEDIYTKTQLKDLAQGLNSTLSPHIPPSTNLPKVGQPLYNTFNCERVRSTPEGCPTLGKFIGPLDQRSQGRKREKKLKPEETEFANQAISLCTHQYQPEPADGVQTDLGSCLCSAAAPLAVSKPTSAFQTTVADIREMQMRMGGLPPYRTDSGPNGIDPDFIEYIREWLIDIRKKDVPFSDARRYITKREPGGSEQLDWPTVLAKAEEWQQSRSLERVPTKGQILAESVAIARNLPQAQVVDRFKKTGGCYDWEIAPGEPVPDILEWYADSHIKFSKRPEMSGKPSVVLARQDFENRFVAAAIFSEYEKWAKRFKANSTSAFESTWQEHRPASEQTVDVVAQASDEQKLKDKIARLQAYLNSEFPMLMNRAVAEVEASQNPKLEIIDGKVEVAF